MQINIEKNQKEIKEHGDYKFPVDVSIEKIQAYEQGAFMWHWHPEVELTCIMSGEIEYHVNERQYFLSEGDGMFANSNMLHAGYMKDGKECTYLTITFHPRFLYGYEGSILQTKYVEFITKNDNWSSLSLSKEVSWQKEILECMREIYEIYEKKESGFELLIQMKLMFIWQRFFLYYRDLPEKEYQPQKHLQRLREIVTFIQENYEKELTLEDVADHVNICKSECCRFFKKHMNMTIFEYLLYYRIQKSLPLLRAGESITKTATLVGFSSAAYYGQIFRRYMKCTPKEYKKAED